MAWILQSVFIIVLTTSASKCKNNYDHTVSEDFPQYQYDEPEYNPQYPRPYHQNYQTQHPRMFGRSADVNERPNQRSFSAHSATQKVQEQERRRIETRISEPTTRIENGSYKILNYPSFFSRRGGSDVTSGKDRIIFPGPTSAKYQEEEIPEECKRLGICNNVSYYPTEEVERALAEFGDTTGKFQRDELDIPDTPDIAQRLGPPEEEMELCYYKLKVVYPKGAVDKNGKFSYIVNRDNDPLQGVKVEVCELEKNINGSCKSIASFPPGYTSYCLQKYVVRKLWALENNKMVEKPFKIPSCCSCVVKSIS